MLTILLHDLTDCIIWWGSIRKNMPLAQPVGHSFTTKFSITWDLARKTENSLASNPPPTVLTLHKVFSNVILNSNLADVIIHV